MISLLQQYGYRGFQVVGALSIIALTLWRRRKYGLSVFSAVCYPILLVACGILGAKLLSFVKSGFTSFEGMAFYGAIFLIMLLMPLVGRLFRLTPAQTLDISAPEVSSFISFFRFGCYCAGCCGGVRCVIGSFAFYWPAQLLESFGDMVLTAVLLQMEQRDDRKGMLYPVFMVSYGSMRFVIECMRGMPTLMLGLSEGHWNSVLSVLIGTIWLLVRRRSAAKRKPAA